MRAIWLRRRARPEDGLSLFLAVYLSGLVGVLLAIHALQPAVGNPEGTSRLPAHQQRHKAANPHPTGAEAPIQTGFAHSL